MNVTNTTTSSSTTSAPASTSSALPSQSLVSQDTFLQLFVAQLKNQDPLSPNQQDPSQMVSELAQFSQLEQVVGIGQDVHSLAQLGANAAAGATNTSTAS